jgi:hypothetical protein
VTRPAENLEVVGIESEAAVFERSDVVDVEASVVAATSALVAGDECVSPRLLPPLRPVELAPWFVGEALPCLSTRPLFVLVRVMGGRRNASRKTRSSRSKPRGRVPRRRGRWPLRMNTASSVGSMAQGERR